MPIDINSLRKDRGGDPDFWRENQRKRFCDPGLVDLVLALDDVCARGRGVNGLARLSWGSVRRLLTARPPVLAQEWRTLTSTIRDIRRDYGLGNKKVRAGGRAGETVCGGHV